KKIKEPEAAAFIFELISNQILVSELEITLTGDDFTNRLVNVQDFKKYPKNAALAKKNKTMLRKEDTDLCLDLKTLSGKLSKIDKLKEFQQNHYQNISETLRNKKVTVNEKYLFQTDLFLNSNEFQLDEKYKNELLNAIKLLNKISAKPKKTSLENFKKAFIRRYEDEAIPLVKALDFETGIRYGSESE
ncbi:hypothetical protein D0809_25045, partial [Flavobacterium circumlabens]